MYFSGQVRRTCRPNRRLRRWHRLFVFQINHFSRQGSCWSACNQARQFQRAIRTGTFLRYRRTSYGALLH